jgi:fumarate reductase subunit C
MNQSHVYTPYHPRWLRRHVSTYWWVEKPSYVAFILREGSCLFVGWSVAYLLLLVAAVVDGPANYQQFLRWSAGPSMLLLNIVTFAFVTFHAITFFQAAPQAMVMRIRHKRVPGRLVLGGHYVAWAVASLFVGWLLLG